MPRVGLGVKEETSRRASEDREGLVLRASI